jgi:hypothetical protein
VRFHPIRIEYVTGRLYGEVTGERICSGIRRNAATLPARVVRVASHKYGGLQTMEIEREVEAVLPGMPEPLRGNAGQRFTCAGKQVMCCAEHYADAVSPEAAQRIAEALNNQDTMEYWNTLAQKVRG